jgi:site-specific recombinase XerD
MGALVDPLDSLREYLASEKAPNTRRAYASDLADFQAWCETAGHDPLPAEPLVVAQYLANLADRGKTAATIGRRAVSISAAHRAAGHISPTYSEGVRAVLRGIRRKLGVAQKRKTPTTARTIAAMLSAATDNLMGKRDAALILVGFGAALRRSEIVALNVEDLELTPEGVRVLIRRSKVDQAGEGYVISVPRGTKLQPMRALEAWLDASGIREGALFRGVRANQVLPARLCDHQVARIVKKLALRAGLDPTTFGGHSMRTGFVTSALESGADVLSVMDVTRHKSVKQLKVYDRRARGFSSHAGKRFL